MNLQYEINELNENKMDMIFEDAIIFLIQIQMKLKVKSITSKLSWNQLQKTSINIKQIIKQTRDTKVAMIYVRRVCNIEFK